MFFWGNKVADSGTGLVAGNFQTTTADAAQVFATVGAGKPVTDLRDYNKDGQVTTNDASIVFANIGNLIRLNVPAVGPFAEPAVASDGSGSAVASALAAKGLPSLPKVPGWITQPAGQRRPEQRQGCQPVHASGRGQHASHPLAAAGGQ